MLNKIARKWLERQDAVGIKAARAAAVAARAVEVAQQRADLIAAFPPIRLTTGRVP